MNRRSYPTFLLLVACAVVSAQGPQKDVKLQLANDNVFRGVVMTDGFVFQPSLDLSPAQGTHLIFWGSLDLEGSSGFDDLRFSFVQDINAVALSGKVGVTRFQRKNGFASTTEVFGSATLPLVGISIEAYKDVDVAEGLYVRAAKSAPLPSISLAGVSAGLRWQSWLGYSDERHAAFYYGHKGAGLADLGGRLSANFGVSQGTLSAWVQATTLLDPDYRSPGGSRAALTFGASLGMKF